VARKSKRARPSVQSRSKRRKVPHIPRRPSPKSSAQLTERSKRSKSRLTGSEKKRGPKPKIRPSEVVNRAYNLRLTFEIAGKQLDWSKVLTAQSTEEIVAAFGAMDESYRRRLLLRPELFLRCLKDPKFPKQDRQAQEEFIADSLAGDGRISIRRSRDICGQARSTERRQGKILRREFYIVCSCGYEGPARFDKCPDCGAEVSYLDLATGFTFRGYTPQSD
jgi:hypothetical protein